MWGWPEPSQGQPVADGEVIETGRYRFQVIYTPAIASTTSASTSRSKAGLFTGDLFVGGRDRALREGYDIWGINRLAQARSALARKRLFPGSARVRDNAEKEIAARSNSWNRWASRCWRCTSRVTAWIRSSNTCSAGRC